MDILLGNLRRSFPFGSFHWLADRQERLNQPAERRLVAAIFHIIIGMAGNLISDNNSNTGRIYEVKKDGKYRTIRRNRKTWFA